jgi:hypothetical protein
MLGSSSCCKNTEDSCAGTDIKNNLIFEVLGVAFYSVSVSIGTNFVFEHLFMNVEVRVAAKVIIVFFFIILQVLCNLLFELDVIEPCLRLARESLLSGRDM